MLQANSNTVFNENNFLKSLGAIGINEKYMYDYPETLKFNFELFKSQFKKTEVIIKNKNDEPLFKIFNDKYFKITDMNNNVIFNFRVEAKRFSAADIKIHTWLENDIFNKNYIKISKKELHNYTFKEKGINKFDSYQVTFSDAENENINLEVDINNMKNLIIYYEKNNQKIEICNNSYKNNEYTLNINSRVDVLLIVSIFFSILQINKVFTCNIINPFD